MSNHRGSALDAGLLVVGGVALAGLVTTLTGIAVTGWRWLYAYALPIFTTVTASTGFATWSDVRRARRTRRRDR